MTNQNTAKSASSSTYDPRTHKPCKNCGKIFPLNNGKMSYGDKEINYCNQKCQRAWWQEWRSKRSRDQNKKNRLELEDNQLASDLNSNKSIKTLTKTDAQRKREKALRVKRFNNLSKDEKLRRRALNAANKRKNRALRKQEELERNKKNDHEKRLNELNEKLQKQFAKDNFDPKIRTIKPKTNIKLHSPLFGRIY